MIKVLQLIIVLTWMTTSANSCSCGQQHPQDAFCSADYVFYGRAIREKLIPGQPDDVHNNFATWNYTFEIIFKMKKISPNSEGCRYQEENTDYATDNCLATKTLCQRKGRRSRWVNHETCYPNVRMSEWKSLAFRSTSL